MHDVIVIGAGPAGITAAVYAIRKKIDVLVISEDIGGQTSWSGDIENYLGYQFITGGELTSKFEDHMRAYGIDLHEGESVKSIDMMNGYASIKTDTGSYEAKTLIIASGKRPRELNVPGEREFRKRGVTYCATCDGPVFGGKDVLVVGGGNSGLEATLQLMNIARYVYLVTNADHLTGDEIYQEKIERAKNVTVFTKSSVQSIHGNVFVDKVIINDHGEEKEIAVSGVFTEIGLLPNTEFVTGINKNNWGEIMVNNRNETNVPYVFAAGDVTNVPEKQIIIAAGEGAKAALSAFRYLALQK